MFNKDIDRLFQEKFKDFEEIPNNKVWKKIDKQLNAKPKINFYKISVMSFVAVLFLILSIWNYSTDTTLPSYKTQNNTVLKETIQKNKIDIVVNENKIIKSGLKKSNVEKSNGDEIISTKVISSFTKNSHKINTSKLKNSKYSKTTKNRSDKTNTIHSNKSKSKINLNQKTNILFNTLDKTIVTTPSKQLAALLNLKIKPIAINKTKNNLKLVDLNDIKLDILKLTNNNLIIKEDFNKWEIGTTIAPVYYASLTKGSPIDSRIANNDKKGSFSYSYGLNITYKFSNKFSIKSGIHNLDLSYITEQIKAYPITDDYSIDHPNISNIQKYVIIPIKQNTTQFSDNAVYIQGNIKQKLSYYEIPIEGKLNLIEKLINLNIIGGVSALFLNKNTLILEDILSSYELGKATNLNKVNYSLNFSIGANVKTSKKWNFSISPSFKYHVNTFSKNAGGFKPYSIGINTGLYYKF